MICFVCGRNLEKENHGVIIDEKLVGKGHITHKDMAGDDVIHYCMKHDEGGPPGSLSDVTWN